MGSFEDGLRARGKAVPFAGDQDGFVVTLDPDSGSVTNARSCGGPETDYASGVGVADDGTTYVVGTYQETASFGDDALTSYGDWDVYLWRLRP